MARKKTQYVSYAFESAPYARAFGASSTEALCAGIWKTKLTASGLFPPTAWATVPAQEPPQI